MKILESGLTRILLVKDEPLLLHRLEKSLQKEGYGVNCCTTVKDALEELKNGHYDLVVTGIMFSDQARVDIVPLIKVFNPSVPVLICSERKEELQIIQAMDLGAHDFIINLNDLSMRIKWALKRTAGRRVS